MMNCISQFVFYFVLLSVVVGCYLERRVSCSKHQHVCLCCVVTLCRLPSFYHPVAMPPCNILWTAVLTLLHNREQLLTGNHEKSVTNCVCARPMCYLANHTQLQLQRDNTN
jgi:hypothetical protein